MGCCISKCRPDKNSLQQHPELFNHVHDKLVISQAPPTPTNIPYQYHSSNKISPSPPSPTSSTSSISSFTCTTTTTSNTLSSTSSLSSKDRSFSNEFLWSCYKDNPHITRINSLKEATSRSSLPTKPNKAQHSNINSSSPKPSFAPMKKLSPPPHRKVVVGSVSMPQKRVRSNSPTNLTRQKSFRKEPTEKLNNISASNVPSRMLGSPSPSRRFVNGNGDHKCATSVSKRMANGTKVSAASYSHCVSSSMRNESFKAAGPNNTSPRLHNGLRHRETCTYRVGSKIDETVVNDVLSSNHDMDSAMMEDIDNPLISFDCFIFL